MTRNSKQGRAGWDGVPRVYMSSMLPVSLKNRIARYCDKNSVNRSDVVACALMEYLDRNERNDEVEEVPVDDALVLPFVMLDLTYEQRVMVSEHLRRDGIETAADLIESLKGSSNAQARLVAARIERAEGRKRA